MTKKGVSSWFQFASNVVSAVTNIRKINFSKLACFVTFPGPFCVVQVHWKPNQHHQNFLILADSLHKVMSKC